MARRTRRPRVVWLPNSNLFSIDSATNEESTYQTFVHNVSGSNPGAAVVSFMPVVKDAPADPLTPTATLADLESSGYRLRRIVGKIWVGVDQEINNGPPEAIATCGFIILRVDPTGVPLNPNIELYGPHLIDTNDDPWIWRRSWIVTNQLSSITAAFFGNPNGTRMMLNNSNANLGGNSDGPHVDAKTARVVSKDERLFLVASTTLLRGGGDEQVTIDVKYVTDLRVLGSLTTSSGNRRNASR